MPCEWAWLSCSTASAWRMHSCALASPCTCKAAPSLHCPKCTSHSPSATLPSYRSHLVSILTPYLYLERNRPSRKLKPSDPSSACKRESPLTASSNLFIVQLLRYSASFLFGFIKQGIQFCGHLSYELGPAEPGNHILLCLRTAASFSHYLSHVVLACISSLCDFALVELPEPQLPVLGKFLPKPSGIRQMHGQGRPPSHHAIKVHS